MSSDPVFEGCGSAVGIESWRVENLGLKKLDKGTANAGKFYEGDSYLLLNTYVNKSTSNSTKLLWNIHFWIGKDSSLDEGGIAAYKAVELDNKLGGSAVQYREVQGSESPQFKAIFKANPGGIEYLPGGVVSGFKKVVSDVYSPRLLRLKGKSTVTVTEKPVQLSSLNKGDVFILDLGLTIFIFNGPTSNRMEKAKGVAVASAINSDERSGRATLVFLDTDPQNQTFWNHFGGFKDSNLLPEGDSDDAVPPPRAKQLFRISDASGTVQFTEVPEAKGGKLSRDMLQSSDVFMLVGQSTVFLWIGKNSTAVEKKEATFWAVSYINDKGLPKSTPVVRISEGNESAAFISQFFSWPLQVESSTGIATNVKDQAVDVAALLAKQTLEERPVDDGSGKLVVWVINNFEKVLVDQSSWGKFYSGDSYILLYSYKNERGLEQHIIYFWLGQDSSADEKGSAALLAKEIDDSMGGKPVQVRVTQGKEPVHFRQLFKGQMILLQGGNPSGFKNRAGDALEKPADIALFQVKSSSSTNTMAVQLPKAMASSLNSGDSFLLVTPTNVFLWNGNGSNEVERAVGLDVASQLAATYNSQAGRAVISVEEGSEPNEFWTALGGKQEYPHFKDVEVIRDARLFSASTSAGAFKVEEIDSFTQTDLNDEDVYLLDTYNSVYVWVGSLSTEDEKTKSLVVAKQYIDEANDGRSKDASIIKVAAGEEPPMFTAHFAGWDPEYSKNQAFKDPYQQALNVSKSSTPAAWGKALRRPSLAPATPTSVSSSSAAVAAPVEATPPSSPSVTLPPGSITVSYEELKANTKSGLDPSRKEEYLDDATFHSLFNMEREAFAKLSKWKKDEQKKKVGLF